MVVSVARTARVARRSREQATAVCPDVIAGRMMALRIFDSLELDYAGSLARRAMDLMSQHRIPPSPDNFSIWFQYVARSSSELNRTIDVLIGNRKTFDEATNRDLVRTYLIGDEQSNLSDKIRGLVSSAKELLASAIDDQNTQIKTLQDVSTQAEIADPKALIGSLLDELLKATSRAKTLEIGFNRTSEELDIVRETLAQSDRSARTDPLTGLANRRGLDEMLYAAQIKAMETGSALSVLLIDIDYFKQFNDTYGHQVGDQVLRLTAGVFRELLREADRAARYGGEELIGVLDGSDLKTARAVAERIRATVSERKMRKRSTGEVLGAITVSIGVAEFQPGESIGELVERADRALYQAKRLGRNRTVTELDLDDDLAA
jgi:diguanylate cyclase